MKWPLRIILTVLLLSVVLSGAAWLTLYGSLPQLDGQVHSGAIQAPVSLSRDVLGQAVIKAESRTDAAYALGFAHAQDRLFQMDLQRRSAAGRLSEWVGDAALAMDKRARFHQFEQRAMATVKGLPDWQQQLLVQYAQGVNDAIAAMTTKPFEYWLLGAQVPHWQPLDSVLVAYSMYMDLQHNQVLRDLALTRVARHFGPQMVDFLLQPSPYQAALDGSEQAQSVDIPSLPPGAQMTAMVLSEPPDIGSNNWAVTGARTNSDSAMLANDMHLGLRVPLIWYRTQLNYRQQEQPVSLTGVSLPGMPGIVVGTNGYIAWGFTNSNLDNTDWVLLDEDTQTTVVEEEIISTEGSHRFAIELSDAGPVKSVQGSRYALRWTAHMPYAVDLDIVQLDTLQRVEDAIPVVQQMGIPVQNALLVDASGNAAWTPGGAVTARPLPSDQAIDSDQLSPLWVHQETDLPVVLNPEHGRLWTANARVISTADLARFGDGGYAVGARASQIRDRLFEAEQFDEQRFYAIQLDNEARFMRYWHSVLLDVLEQSPDKHDVARQQVMDWQGCACADSVGYTLVRRFRANVIAALMSPLASTVNAEGVSFRPLMRHVEPAVRQLLQQRPEDWLRLPQTDWQGFLLAKFEQAMNELQAQHGNDPTLNNLRWGTVNALAITHPFAAQIPWLGEHLNMPVVDSFGDSFVPAVQAPTFGASQRLFVRPGDLDKAILVLPGGQSGHPLSDFYRAGFDDFARHQSTPLLPQDIQHTLRLIPQPAN
ncbi:penicillin acylase family protein [Aestuariibacter halophilus]|uniref:Penicillin acylase family protein n=1 Tax=Fluctibacter halophilus TaxID=226011 RepID=A0ABS8G684_9ALTE|nr:penicillin acylase family protein [Aestuariibacter halophilus]MCC2616045.1 penicillin acylase family protein [Aestuariibacter halophilus]